MAIVKEPITIERCLQRMDDRHLVIKQPDLSRYEILKLRKESAYLRVCCIELRKTVRERDDEIARMKKEIFEEDVRLFDQQLAEAKLDAEDIARKSRAFETTLRETYDISDPVIVIDFNTGRVG